MIATLAWMLTLPAIGAPPLCVSLLGTPEATSPVSEALALGPVRTGTTAGCRSISVRREADGGLRLILGSGAVWTGEEAGAAGAIEAALVEDSLEGRSPSVEASPPSPSPSPARGRISAGPSFAFSSDGGRWVGARVRLEGDLGRFTPFLQVRVQDGNRNEADRPRRGGTDAEALLGLGLRWTLDRLWLGPSFGLGFGYLRYTSGFPVIASLRAELGVQAGLPLWGPFGLEAQVGGALLPALASTDNPLDATFLNPRFQLRASLGLTAEL